MANTILLEDSPSHQFLSALFLWESTSEEVNTLFDDITNKYTQWNQWRENNSVASEELEKEDNTLLERLSEEHIAKLLQMIEYFKSIKNEIDPPLEKEIEQVEVLSQEMKQVNLIMQDLAPYILKRRRMDCKAYYDALEKGIEFLKVEDEKLKRSRAMFCINKDDNKIAIKSIIAFLETTRKKMEKDIKIHRPESVILPNNNYLSKMIGEVHQGITERANHQPHQSIFEKLLTIIKNAFGVRSLYDKAMETCSLSFEKTMARQEQLVQWITEGELFDNPPLPRMRA